MRCRIEDPTNSRYQHEQVGSTGRCTSALGSIFVCLVLAETVASERQLTGIINFDDSFKATGSVDRVSSLDPEETINTSTLTPASGRPSRS